MPFRQKISRKELAPWLPRWIYQYLGSQVSFCLSVLQHISSDMLMVDREHLNRRHKTPIYCKRCSRVFTHEFLLKSHDQYDICRERGEPFDTSDYMTDHIWATLRGHRSALNLSEPLKWEVFYDILFPDQPPPSPCTYISAESW